MDREQAKYLINSFVRWHNRRYPFEVLPREEVDMYVRTIKSNEIIDYKEWYRINNSET